MQASRRELLDDFVDFVGDANDGRARDTAERLLNRALHTIWMKHPWRQFQMPVPLQIPLVPGQRLYALPAHFGRIAGGRVRNLTQQYALAAVEALALQTAHPEIGTNQETPGRPELFTVSGTCGVRRLLVTPLPLSVMSTAAADIGTVRVTIEGYADAAATVWVSREVIVAGTTPIPVTPPLIPWTFGKAYVSTAPPTTELTSSAGDMVLRAEYPDLTIEVLQTLGPYQSAAEHQVLTVYPVPDTADMLVVPYLRAVSKAVYDGDPVPDNWQEAVFEEMTIQWRVNTGEISLDTMNVVRPKFLDLLAFELANRFETVQRIRPFR